MAQLIRQRVMSCEQCIRESSVTQPALQNPSEHITAPEATMQNDSVPEIPLSAGYENIVIALDVFSKYLFAYPTSRKDRKTVAKVIFNTVIKDANLPTTIVSGKGSFFMSQVIKEVAEVLGTSGKHATTTHSQTIAML